MPFLVRAVKGGERANLRVRQNADELLVHSDLLARAMPDVTKTPIVAWLDHQPRTVYVTAGFHR
jgi:hypothetical protein